MRVLLAIFMLFTVTGLYAEEPQVAEKAANVTDDDAIRTSLPVGLFVQTDVKKMFEEAETRLLLRKLMEPTLGQPKWIPAYSTAPKGNPLDESRHFNAGFNFLSRSDEGKYLFFTPCADYRLRTWEETPDIILDRAGARDYLISK